MSHSQQRFVIALPLIMLSSLAMASPLLTITPSDYTYHDPAVAVGTTLSIPYTITNNTPVALSNIKATQLPNGITSSTCASIPSGDQCTLTLTVSSDLTSTPGTLRADFQVCTNTPSAGCTRVSSSNAIHVQVTNDNTFLVMTDVHLRHNIDTPITYGEDTGTILWSSTRSKLTSLMATQHPKFMLLLGDLPGHHAPEELEANLGAVLTGLSGLPAINNSQFPVFYAPGNNDSLVSNYNIFSSDGVNLFSLDPTHNWPALNTNPDCTHSPTQACTYEDDMTHAQTDGYYSAFPLGSATPLRLIVLNSVIFSFEFALTGAEQLSAAQAQMDWLADQLADASEHHEAVYIAMHIPPGNDAFNHSEDFWNDTLFLQGGLQFRDAFLALMTQYKDTVRALFTGHTHLDELRVLYADHNATQVSVLDVGVPGITPQHYNNPGMKLFLYNDTHEIMEAKTFYTTPDASTWTSYSFQDDYSCPANSTMLSCVESKFLPKLPSWIAAPQPIPGNRYETNFPVRYALADPTIGGISSWLAILTAIQVVPII